MQIYYYLFIIIINFIWRKGTQKAQSLHKVVPKEEKIKYILKSIQNRKLPIDCTIHNDIDTKLMYKQTQNTELQKLTRK